MLMCSSLFPTDSQVLPTFSIWVLPQAVALNNPGWKLKTPSGKRKTPGTSQAYKLYLDQEKKHSARAERFRWMLGKNTYHRNKINMKEYAVKSHAKHDINQRIVTYHLGSLGTEENSYIRNSPEKHFLQIFFGHLAFEVPSSPSWLAYKVMTSLLPIKKILQS